MSPLEAFRLVGHQAPEPESVQRAREQARFQTDKVWGAAIIERALREDRHPGLAPMFGSPATLETP